MAAITKMAHGNKNVHVDPKTINYWCKIPTYTHDMLGRAIVKMRDCNTGNWVIYSDAEFKRLQNMGKF